MDEENENVNPPVPEENPDTGHTDQYLIFMTVNVERTLDGDVNVFTDINAAEMQHQSGDVKAAALATAIATLHGSIGMLVMAGEIEEAAALAVLQAALQMPTGNPTGGEKLATS